MQKKQFHLGNDTDDKQTTYVGTIINSAKLAETTPVERVNNLELALKSRKTKILMGTDSEAQISEAKTAFTSYAVTPNNKMASKNLIEDMKKPNFSLAERPVNGQVPNYYEKSSISGMPLKPSDRNYAQE